MNIAQKSHNGYSYTVIVVVATNFIDLVIDKTPSRNIRSSVMKLVIMLQLASMPLHHVSPISAIHTRRVGACPRASLWSRSPRCTRRRRTTTPPPLTHTTAAHSHTISSSCTVMLRAPGLTGATALGRSMSKSCFWNTFDFLGTKRWALIRT